MACTLNILSTLNWALPYIDFQPMTIGGQDPALTAAQMTLEVMLGPPFRWRQNRNTATYTCTIGDQDNAAVINDFGFAEIASIASANLGSLQISKEKALTLDGSEPSQPAHFAEQYDDNLGNITFRLSPPPDQAYVVTVDYQMKAPQILSLASFWAPMPDEYAYIYNWGFLTMAAMLAKDPRMPTYSQKFVGHLLGAQSGLTEMEINIFLGTYLQRTGQASAAGMMLQQGVTGRTF